MDNYDKKKLDDISDRLRTVEVKVAEMSKELAYKSQVLDEHRKDVRTIILRINATFITGLLSVIAALLSALYYK